MGGGLLFSRVRGRHPSLLGSARHPLQLWQEPGRSLLSCRAIGRPLASVPRAGGGPWRPGTHRGKAGRAPAGTPSAHISFLSPWSRMTLLFSPSLSSLTSPAAQETTWKKPRFSKWLNKQEACDSSRDEAAGGWSEPTAKPMTGTLTQSGKREAGAGHGWGES